jgi:Tfp pilus assembly protein PilO
MRIGKLGSIMPTQSLVFLALGAAAILAFIFLIILPEQRLAAELDREIAGLTARIEEQRVLAPIFTTLFAKAKAPAASGLPAPTRAKLARAEIGGALKHLQELAAAHKMTVRELTPDVNTLTDASAHFLVQLLANGQFMDLRGFLIDIGALPYFESLEEIEIKSVEGNTKEIGLKISLTRE